MQFNKKYTPSVEDLHHVQKEYEEIINKHAKKVYLDYAKARSDYEALDRRKSAMLASLMKLEEGSNPERKMKAESSKEWVDFIEGLNQASRDYNHATATKQYLEDKIDMLRSFLSTEREKVKRWID